MTCVPGVVGIPADSTQSAREAIAEFAPACRLAADNRGAAMGDIIKLDSNHKSNTKAVVKDSVLTCTKTSAPDVYVTGIAANKEEHTLHVGESMIVPKLSTLIVRIFRVSSKDEPFSAELDLSPIPDAGAPAPKAAARRAAKPARRKAR